MDALVIYVPWILSALALAWAIYLKGHSNRVRVTDHHDALLKKQDERIRELELDMARQQSPLMKQVQDLLTAGLHHPDPKHSRQDRLLEKLDNVALTPDEVPELIAVLDAQIADPSTPPIEAEAASALKALMPLVVKEREVTKMVEDRMGRTTK